MNDKDPWKGKSPILSWDLQGKSVLSPQAWQEYIMKRRQQADAGGEIPYSEDIPCMLVFTDDYLAMAVDILSSGNEDDSSSDAPAGPPVYLGMVRTGEWKGKTVGVARVGVGGPLAASTMEQLIALGIKYLIAIGIAGGIAPDIRLGDVLVPDRALREEGTSYHYLAPSTYAEPSKLLQKRIEAALSEKNIPFRTGGTWTTDAIWRETEAKVQRYASLGIVSVEMELASLAAVARYRGVDLGAVFCISDLVGREGWELGFHNAELEIGMSGIMESAFDVLSSL